MTVVETVQEEEHWKRCAASNTDDRSCCSRVWPTLG